MDLDGTWRVERTGGLLPPLIGVRKRIHGTHGATLVGRSLGFRFDVVGRELRYRPPLTGLVDVLDGDGDVLSGRATFFGRELGRFRMTRISRGPGTASRSPSAS